MARSPGDVEIDDKGAHRVRAAADDRLVTFVEHELLSTGGAVELRCGSEVDHGVVGVERGRGVGVTDVDGETVARVVRE